VGAAGETPTMGGCRRVPDRRQLDLPPRSLVLFSERHRRAPRGSEAAAPGGALRAMDSSARPRLGRTESSSQVSTRRLASSALPRNSNGSSGEPGSMVICDSVLPNTRAPTTNNSGSTHNAPLNCSDRSPTAAGASEPPDLRGTAHRGSPDSPDSPRWRHPRPVATRRTSSEFPRFKPSQASQAAAVASTDVVDRGPVDGRGAAS
jgi:hypothetical protein